MESGQYFFDVAILPGTPTPLFPIMPNGLGTGDVEAITGYVLRLAREHCVSPHKLVEDVIFPAIENLTSRNLSTNSFRSKRWQHIAGVGIMSKAWAEALRNLTGRQDLQCCTLRWTSAVIANIGLVTPRARYCPVCLVHDVESNRQPYDRLLWHIDAVTACPLHGVRLREKNLGCKTREGQPTNGFRRVMLSGYCTNCGKVAYRCDPSPPEVASVQEIWIAKQVYALVAYGTSGKELSQDGLAKGLQRLADQMFSGQLTSLAKQSRLSKSQIWEWGHKRPSKPSLPSLLQLCSSVGCTLTSLLLGAPVLEPNVSLIQLCRGKHNPVDYKLAETILRTAVEALDGSRSLTEIAKLVGAASPKSLTAAFPALSKRIVELNGAFREHQRQIYRDAAKVETGKVLEELAKRNLAPTLRSVQKVTGSRWGRKTTKGRLFMELRPPMK